MTIDAASRIQAGAMVGSTAVGTVTAVAGTLLDIQKGANMVKMKDIDGKLAVASSPTPTPIKSH